MAPLVVGHVYGDVVEVRSPVDGRLLMAGGDSSAATPTLARIERDAVCARVARGDDAAQVVEVVAPLSGVISGPPAPTGQFLSKGDVILTITSGVPKYIVCSFPESAPAPPRPGEPVAVRSKAPGAEWVRSTIQAVGPAVETRPPRTPDVVVPETGWPVRVALPAEHEFAAGATVEVRFLPSNRK